MRFNTFLCIYYWPSGWKVPVQVSCPVFCQTVFLIDTWVFFVYWGCEPFVSCILQPLSPILARLFTPFFLIFICLAALSLHCSTRDLCCVLRGLSSRCINSLAVVHGLSSCSMWAQLPHSMWTSQFPNQGLTLHPAAVQGRFLTTGPLRKSPTFYS